MKCVILVSGIYWYSLTYCGIEGPVRLEVGRRDFKVRNDRFYVDEYDRGGSDY